MWRVMVCSVADVTCMAGGQGNAADRMETHKEIMQRRRMVDLAKAQSQEVATLRAEVERLRMRTFAALVQVDPH